MTLKYLRKKVRQASTEMVTGKKKKKIKKPPVESIEIFCSACTQRFILRKKDDSGKLIEQYCCPHTVLRKVNYK